MLPVLGVTNMATKQNVLKLKSWNHLAENLPTISQDKNIYCRRHNQHDLIMTSHEETSTNVQVP